MFLGQPLVNKALKRRAIMEGHLCVCSVPESSVWFGLLVARTLLGWGPLLLVAMPFAPCSP